MSASSRASLAGKRGEMIATAMALLIAVGAGSRSASAQQSPENPPAAWRVECTGDGKTLDCRAAVEDLLHHRHGDEQLPHSRAALAVRRHRYINGTHPSWLGRGDLG